MAFKIINLPKDAMSALKDVIKSDGSVKKEKDALFAISDYLIFTKEASAVYDIALFVAENDGALAKEFAKRAFLILAEEKAFSIEERRNTLVKSLEECIKENKELNFEGFMTFRTENYIRILYGAVYRAAEEITLKKEYEEMKGLLRECVKDASPLVKEAHIYGPFIFDESGKEMTREKGLYLVKPDRMLTTLLTLAPEKIYIHYPPEEEMLSAIKEVFSPNVIYIN